LGRVGERDSKGGREPEGSPDLLFPERSLVRARNFQPTWRHIKGKQRKPPGRKETELGGASAEGAGLCPGGSVPPINSKANFWYRRASGGAGYDLDEAAAQAGTFGEKNFWGMRSEATRKKKKV